MEPYATSHQALDKDEAFQEEVRNVARALGKAVVLHRAGKYVRSGRGTGRSKSEIVGGVSRRCEGAA